MEPKQVFVHGAAVRMSWADASSSLEDLIFTGVTAALSEANLPIDAIDSVVLSAHDMIDGRSLSSMVAAPAAGCYLRDEIRLAEDGLVALSLGAARVAGHESEYTIVAAWGRASEGDFLNVSRASMDPFMEQAFRITESDLSGFRLSRWLTKYGLQHSERDAAARARNSRAGLNPRSVGGISPMLSVNYPLMPFDAPRSADIVVAAIIGAPKSKLRVAGIGHGTDSTLFGDRDWLARPALRTAVNQALKEAGCGLADLNLFEIDGMTLSDEALALESLGLAAPGNGFETYARASHINPSGGSAAGWCYPAMGLVRFAECMLRLPDHGTRGIAIGSSPIGAQTQTAIVLEMS